MVRFGPYIKRVFYAAGQMSQCFFEINKIEKINFNFYFLISRASS